MRKNWANLFRTPHFIAQHLRHSNQSPFLLLQRIRRSPTSTPSSFCLIGPDLTVHEFPYLDFASNGAKVVGSCNGLLCLRHSNHALSICNPATRQVTQVPQTLTDVRNFYYFGFGYSALVNDYKIVRICVCQSDDDDDNDGNDGIVVLDDIHVNQVEVYSLASGSWRQVDATNLQNLCPFSNAVAAGGGMFWKATASPELGSSQDPDECLVSFDIGRDDFRLLRGPESHLSLTTYSCNSVLAEYVDKLAIFHQFMMGNSDNFMTGIVQGSLIDLWVLDNTQTYAVEGERWIKLYTLGPFSRILYPISIWGDQIVCREELFELDGEYGRVKTTLSILNPYSSELKNLPAHRNDNYYVSFNYAESLVSSQHSA
ncbi:hypothetical protein PIB30_102751 [Stylosanthes scabra]|uniref:F-box associated beta-propeller type 3 domain-containing protein n=1 Tax=Stylosanthes scabra TaxID=79078 RepID=A0ABU6RXW7_9FABA|nr:hypothetical protein [Stylosanthes scabra]